MSHDANDNPFQDANGNLLKVGDEVVVKLKITANAEFDGVIYCVAKGCDTVFRFPCKCVVMASDSALNI